MTKEHITHAERVVVDADIMAGKPVIRGTRIPIELILERLSQNLDLDELFASYPRLTREDVKAALEYAEARLRNEEVYPSPV